ncbi:fumarylacetoacetate hydrolase family protein [Bradyrhizobium sp. JYMT SZCCT0180]|uniref:fumarylacetoacetate hydrolase family protein n=1 Tax=Bradyrhizobium sp. JYMT SZCCT0180 TaxID=2807666 RepID=UPI001BAA0B7D|nr:fumarylacetoacetate hydrolase family protein [Bradyrhizobium sp. JYMT SZCCT0180]MBR1214203.1 fumarylacetoacetate hydrolase family protein [Bradyrhizobium sp. JYMT SZCCT0180]
MNAGVRKYVYEPEVTSVAIAGQSMRFPVRRIYCVGRNYVDHIREMKEGDERDPPFFFQKPADAIVEHGAEVPYPPHTSDFQYEVELVIAVGRGGRSIGIASALDHVFGYAVGIDLTRRDRQRDARAAGLPWEVGKSFDASAPCGPICRAADIGHLSAGKVTLSVNGDTRQTGDIAQMIWNCSEIVANLSLQYALAAGDLIFTGTPAGVGPVGPGDRLVAEIASIGKLALTIGSREA